MPKEYGGHQYADHGTSDCEHGCGCWTGPFKSGGPSGLDPFGECPKNPKDGELLGGNDDYDFVVSGRILNLESRLRAAEGKLKKVRPSKTKLADELERVRADLSAKNLILAKIHRLAENNT